jgi:hypothetical protein
VFRAGGETLYTRKRVTTMTRVDTPLDPDEVIWVERRGNSKGP